MIHNFRNPHGGRNMPCQWLDCRWLGRIPKQHGQGHLAKVLSRAPSAYWYLLQGCSTENITQDLDDRDGYQASFFDRRGHPSSGVLFRLRRARVDKAPGVRNAMPELLPEVKWEGREHAI